MSWKRSFDDLGDRDHLVALCGGIAQRLRGREPGTGLVLLPDVVLRIGVRGRFDVGDIYLGEALDVTEQLGELPRERGFFLRREREARETRQRVEVEFEGERSTVYALNDLTGIDLFPNTAHVETVASFTRL